MHDDDDDIFFYITKTALFARSIHFTFLKFHDFRDLRRFLYECIALPAQVTVDHIRKHAEDTTCLCTKQKQQRGYAEATYL